MPETTTPARVFCSYSHLDDEFRKDLEAHLSVLARQNLITFWYDRRIVPGDEWGREIATQLEEADIILLLISAYFINSDYCYQIELGRALQRHHDGSAAVIPIFVRACDWAGLNFANLQGLPPDSVPVNDYDDPHKAWTLVTRGVRQACDHLISRRTMPASVASLSEASRTEKDEYEVHAYLRHLVVVYDREPWTSHPIALNAEIDGQVVSVESALQTWATSDTRRVLLLSGNPGSGKTWAFRQLAAALAGRILTDHSPVPLPLYVPLHSLQRGDALSAISATVPEARAVVEQLAAGTSTVVLFDGIDEIVVNSVDDGLQTLVDMLKSTSTGIRVAVSCRTQAAISVLEGLHASGYVAIDCRIRDASQSEVYKYLKRLALPVEFNLTGISGAMRYPIELRMLEEALPQLTLGAASANIADIYAAAISALIRAARDRDKRLAIVTEPALFSVLTKFAERMFPRLTLSIGEIRIDGISGTQKLDVINGLVATGLISLDARELIAFTHASLFEFFFARLLNEELSVWDAKHLSRSNLIYSYNVNRFLVPMLLRNTKLDLTPAALDVRRRLENDSVHAGNAFITRPIRESDFVAFAEDTGWRRDTGFGQWLELSAPDGTVASSDDRVMPEPNVVALASWSKCAEVAAVSLSWYDAHQFARWIGGQLPFTAQLSQATNARAPEMEWTSDWLDESQALISVIAGVSGEPVGVNPDVRSSRIGFRISML